MTLLFFLLKISVQNARAWYFFFGSCFITAQNQPDRKVKKNKAKTKSQNNYNEVTKTKARGKPERFTIKRK